MQKINENGPIQSPMLSIRFDLLINCKYFYLLSLENPYYKSLGLPEKTVTILKASAIEITEKGRYNSYNTNIWKYATMCDMHYSLKS